MIPRYEIKEMTEIWSDENKFNTFLKVELAILKAMEGKIIPEGISEVIEKNAKVNPSRIYEIEKETKHDVIAFCTSITENIDPEVSKFFHFGVTSSDIIDTSLSLQIKESLELIIPELLHLCTTLLEKAKDTEKVLTIGRSHGMFAEPMSFSLKFLSSYHEFLRRFNDLNLFYTNELTGQFSGAVGNYTILSKEVEEDACKSLDLKVEPVSTQVIPRDRISKLISINAQIAVAIERLCVEIRHLSRSDVKEVSEGFSKGQKGSSTMPHKKNPISTENLTGMARVLKSHLSIALDNSILWHERDISHSSAERFYIPDNLGILLYSLRRLQGTVENLVIHKDNIEKKVQENSSYLSSFYLHFLLANTSLSREENYRIIQAASFEADKSKSTIVFHEKVQAELKVHNIELKLPRPSFDEIRKIYTKEVANAFATLN